MRGISMPYINEIAISSNTLTPELLKKWITELTAYTPQQVNIVISEIEQKSTAKTAQYNLTSHSL